MLGHRRLRGVDDGDDLGLREAVAQLLAQQAESGGAGTSSWNTAVQY